MSHPTFSARVSLLVVAVLLICGCSNKRTPVSRSEAIDGGASTLKTGLVEERTAIKTSDLQRLVDLEDIRKLHLDYAAFNAKISPFSSWGCMKTSTAKWTAPGRYRA